MHSFARNAPKSKWINPRKFSYFNSCLSKTASGDNSHVLSKLSCIIQPTPPPLSSHYNYTMPTMALISQQLYKPVIQCRGCYQKQHLVQQVTFKVLFCLCFLIVLWCNSIPLDFPDFEEGTISHLNDAETFYAVALKEKVQHYEYKCKVTNACT